MNLILCGMHKRGFDVGVRLPDLVRDGHALSRSERRRCGPCQLGRFWHNREFQNRPRLLS